MISNLPNSLGFLLDTLRSTAVTGQAPQSASAAAGQNQLGPFPLGNQRGNFQLGVPSTQSSQGQAATQ